MPMKKKTQTLCYVYDPLDRLVISQREDAGITQMFYCRDRVSTEHRDNVRLQVFEFEEAIVSYQVLQNGTPHTLLIAGDENRSTLNILNNNQRHAVAYTPYGYHLQEADTPQLLGFNGERLDPFTGYYLLGNGYRAFNPQLMRFNSPDSWSPFGKGGINAYAYCEGDPVNRVDPTGHGVWSRIFRFSLRRKRTSFPTLTPATPNNYTSLPRRGAEGPVSTSTQNLVSPSRSSSVSSSSSASLSSSSEPRGWMPVLGDTENLEIATQVQATERFRREVGLNNGIWAPIPSPPPLPPRRPLSMSENRPLRALTAPPAVPPRPASALKAIRDPDAN